MPWIAAVVLASIVDVSHVTYLIWLELVSASSDKNDVSQGVFPLTYRVLPNSWRV